MAMPSRKSKAEASCGNIFADLELPDANELLLKAELAWELRRLIEQRGLTQAAAARLTGTAQPDISNLLRGRLQGFSVERLMRMLAALGQDLEIVIRARRGEGEPGRIQVDVQSSAVAAIGYEPAGKTLEVEFVSGEIYQYSEVPEATFKAFRKAESKGTFFQDRVRGRFPYARVTSKRRAGADLSADSPSAARSSRSRPGR
jgi:predicted XRE-type DNA-binding protein